MIAPLQKPSRYDRKRFGVDTSELAQPKAHFDHNGDFRSYVTGHSCHLSPFKNNECGGVSEFNHIGEHGLGIKGSDLHGVCLCSNHHRLSPGSYHHLGSIEAFDATHGTNLWRENTRLLVSFLLRKAKREYVEKHADVIRQLQLPVTDDDPEIWKERAYTAAQLVRSMKR